MNHRVVTLPQAERDIQIAARWIFHQSRSSRASIAWVRRVRDSIQTLRTSPLRCPIDPDAEQYGDEVRVLLFGKQGGQYKILFSVQADIVRIVAVRHAARD